VRSARLLNERMALDRPRSATPTWVACMQPRCERPTTRDDLEGVVIVTYRSRPQRVPGRSTRIRPHCRRSAAAFDSSRTQTIAICDHGSMQ
jgi:hypothetical protein